MRRRPNNCAASPLNSGAPASGSFEREALRTGRLHVLLRSFRAREIENRVDIVGRDSVPIVLDGQKPLRPGGAQRFAAALCRFSRWADPRSPGCGRAIDCLTRLPSRTRSEPAPSHPVSRRDRCFSHPRSHPRILRSSAASLSLGATAGSSRISPRRRSPDRGSERSGNRPRRYRSARSGAGFAARRSSPEIPADLGCRRTTSGFSSGFQPSHLVL